jgi:hypothetical protein
VFGPRGWGGRAGPGPARGGGSRRRSRGIADGPTPSCPPVVRVPMVPLPVRRDPCRRDGRAAGDGALPTPGRHPAPGTAPDPTPWAGTPPWAGSGERRSARRCRRPPTGAAADRASAHLLRDGRDRALQVGEAHHPSAEEAEQDDQLPAGFEQAQGRVHVSGRRRRRGLRVRTFSSVAHFWVRTCHQVSGAPE